MLADALACSAEHIIKLIYINKHAGAASCAHAPCCLPQGSDPGAKDRDGCTPLYCAAAWNRPAAVKKLDELGCPSWVRSEEGRTPVHVAAEQGWVALIDLLVRELRNKVDSRDAYQFTPLHSAANGGHVGTIQKLINFSHDVNVCDYLGRCTKALGLALYQLDSSSCELSIQHRHRPCGILETLAMRVYQILSLADLLDVKLATSRNDKPKQAA